MSGQFGAAGGMGGGAFDAPPPSTGGPWKISEISGAWGNYVFQLEVEWTSATNTKIAGPFGGSGGTAFSCSLGTAQYVTGVSGWVGLTADAFWVTAVQFDLSDGTKSPLYGGGSGVPFSFTCPPGYQVVGIFGRSGAVIDALGVYIDVIPS